VFKAMQCNRTLYMRQVLRCSMAFSGPDVMTDFIQSLINIVGGALRAANTNVVLGIGITENNVLLYS